MNVEINNNYCEASRVIISYEKSLVLDQMANRMSKKNYTIPNHRSGTIQPKPLLFSLSPETVQIGSIPGVTFPQPNPAGSNQKISKRANQF